MFKKLKHGIPKSRLAFLREVPMFEGLPDKALARIDSELDEVDLPAGRDLTVQGSGSYEAFIIEEGVAEVRMDGELVRQTSRGEMIGELGLVRHTTRSATVTATTPMRLLVIDPRQIRWLFEDPTLARRVQENMKLHLGTADE